ncbi:sacsin N-terminal ATP-binding-like domain-containing protein [Hymenobacter terrestris]|uniref:DUF3883 domain-containing protein n=1 Tax=Hymenobacter terrestris TaxID=2748310 RepID=A0ABX2Q3E5_9BACT|nr:DUF3883 domain-containing protein [Hymenobacter terrestris]NVO84282.1 DUF3883 domain-containing protein [Hymenobacter terrestris]
MSNVLIQVDERIALEEEAKRQSGRKDMKQHADKLIKGFKELDKTAAQRGVWELTQNACDLTESGRITVDFQEGKFSFSHNGDAFTVDTLLSLIKQVSSKDSTGEESGEEKRKKIGRFGTGFITTHSYGRTLLVSGSLKLAPSNYVALDEFCIDRTDGRSEDLLLKIEHQQNEVYSKVRESVGVTTPRELTTLAYVPASDTERNNISQALASVKLSMPYVMALNGGLKEATVIDEQGNSTHYRKGEAHEWQGLWRLPIEFNDTTQLLHCLCPPDSELQIVLPLSEHLDAHEWPKDLARLFLYFPLIGSDKWGCNFLVHSSAFAPTNERDGLHLTLENDQARDEALLNRKELTRASELIFDFLERMAEQVKQPLRLARVRFDAVESLEDDDFRKDLQKQWVDKFRELPLVETSVGRRKPMECFFLKQDLLLDEEVIPAIQTVAEKLWGGLLPLANLADEWDAVLMEWHDITIQRIGSKELAEAIAKSGELQRFEPDVLRQVYVYWLKRGQQQLFDAHTLLPDRLLHFKSRADLQRGLNLDSAFIEVLELVLPAKMGGLVEDDFELGLGLTPYNRHELAANVTEQGRLLIDQGVSKVPDDVRKGLLRLCSIFPNETATVTNSLRWRLMPELNAFYGEIYQPHIIANVADDEVRYEETPLRLLVKLVLLDFKANYESDAAWKVTALPQLLTLLDLVSSSADLRSEVLMTAAVFPNQLGELCLSSGLSREQGFSPSAANEEINAEQLKDWYREGMGTDCRKGLLDQRFDLVGARMGLAVEDGAGVAGRLETKLAEQLIEKIESHPKQRLIVEIINKMTAEKGWEDYFSRINAKKADVMLAKISDPTVKDNLFGIISLKKDQIALLGQLAQSDNLGDLLDQAEKLLQKEKDQAFSFAFKKLIGVGIENLIRKNLKDQVQGLEVLIEEQQNGQDIVLRLNGEVIYQIEVKSRWDSKYSVTMSYRQLSEAIQHPDRYALCSVDLVDYKLDEPAKRHQVEDIAQIQDRIRFVTSIGHQIHPLVEGLKAVEADENAVRLADEYRVIIPQRAIAKGRELKEFIAYMMELINQ